jgi:alkylmercury lyase
MTAEIRPGIYRPDWSVVTTLAAREALQERDASRLRLAGKWDQTLDPVQDHVWRTVHKLFARSGRSPRLHEIGVETGLTLENLRTLLADLQAHDLLGIDPTAQVVLYAYPFTGEQTEHHVQLCGRELHAVCAIDALGVAGMSRTDVIIESYCRDRGSRIAIAIVTTQAGKSLSYVQPANAVLWYDLACSGCAAVSCCRSTALFCSEAELQRWLRTQDPQPAGYRLTLAEALEVGRALFEPVLAAQKLR